MLLRIFITSLILGIGSIEANPKADFDGDGEVGFSDYILFAQAYESAEAKFDLDGNGNVDFGDFVLFSSAFGKPLGAAKVTTPKPEELEAAAKAYRDSKQYEQAIQKYGEFLAAVTDSVSMAKGLKEIGVTYLAMGNMGAASTKLQEVLEKYGNSADQRTKYQLSNCNTYLGYIYYLQGNIELAAQQWAKAHEFKASIPFRKRDQ